MILTPLKREANFFKFASLFVRKGLMDKMVAKIFAMPYIIRDYKG
ncbi:Hypothetical protein Ccan_16260 [Capnocytophaga canimorsus Cc5]|uniref:Uncharacterized protein n=1 Tax=Capnocytophaga canimorsus (strain 5) TaxID=860228 RepID=F9YRU1_CAPCC|nr:Hypothetical protein Ccan_16260 [Capnocytophaga canimorsus Cc5]